MQGLGECAKRRRVSESSPSFFSRIFLAWIAFFRTLFDPQFAAGVVELGRTALPSSEPRLGPHHEAQRESRPLDSQGRSPQAHSGEPARAPDDGPKPPEASIGMSPRGPRTRER